MSKSPHALINVPALRAQIESEFLNLDKNLHDSEYKILIMAGAELFKMRVHHAITTKIISLSDFNLSIDKLDNL